MDPLRQIDVLVFVGESYMESPPQGQTNDFSSFAGKPESTIDVMSLHEPAATEGFRRPCANHSRQGLGWSGDDSSDACNQH
jgi:hypothetical protein